MSFFLPKSTLNSLVKPASPFSKSISSGVALRLESAWPPAEFSTIHKSCHFQLRWWSSKFLYTLLRHLQAMQRQFYCQSNTHIHSNLNKTCHLRNHATIEYNKDPNIHIAVHDDFCLNLVLEVRLLSQLDLYGLYFLFNILFNRRKWRKIWYIVIFI